MLRVLLVEDSEPVRIIVEKQLRHDGIDVVCAKTGEAALEIAKGENNLQVAILDRVLPGRLDGDALIRSLREWHPDLGIIQMTGHPSMAGRPQNDSECDVHLVKPVLRDELLDAVSYAYQAHAILEGYRA